MVWEHASLAWPSLVLVDVLLRNLSSLTGHWRAGLPSSKSMNGRLSHHRGVIAHARVYYAITLPVGVGTKTQKFKKILLQ